MCKHLSIKISISSVYVVLSVAYIKELIKKAIVGFNYLFSLHILKDLFLFFLIILFWIYYNSYLLEEYYIETYYRIQ